MILAGTSSQQVSQRLVVWPENSQGTLLRVRSAASASIEYEGISHHRDGEKLEDVERAEQARIGLEELPDETLRRIDQDEEIEGAGAGPGGAAGERGEVASEEGE